MSTLQRKRFLIQHKQRRVFTIPQLLLGRVDESNKREQNYISFKVTTELDEQLLTRASVIFEHIKFSRKHRETPDSFPLRQRSEAIQKKYLAFKQLPPRSRLIKFI